MGGFREFAPGQVWFYYNPAASKRIEEKTERGALTNRPVVIVQSAVYPEWGDTITVVPMTHSDRRSGIYIDTTILRDGVKVEGGTILPYLFYTVKTKYLYAIKGADNRRRIVSLQDEDFEKVRHGYLYHLGERADPPEYVTNWKHLDDVERHSLIRSVRLFLDDFEDALDTELLNRRGRYKYSSLQPGKESVEVHDEPVSEPTTPVVQASNKSPQKIKFETLTPEEFYDEIMSSTEDRLILAKHMNRIFDGSKFLSGLSYRDARKIMTGAEQAYALLAPLNEIVENTGIGSVSSASRLRSAIREGGITEDNCKTWVEYPGGFMFNGNIKTNMTRVRKNAKRRQFLFSISKEERLKISTMTVEEILERYPNLPRNSARNLCVDIEFMYPTLVQNRYVNIREEIATTNTENDRKYELFETLSIQEAKEVSRVDKKNIMTIAKRYGINKDQARSLRGTAINMTSKYPTITLPDLEKDEVERSMLKIANGSFDQLTDRDLYIFCRTDAMDIVHYFNAAHASNCPNKEEIQNIKFDIRSRIVKPFMI